MTLINTPEQTHVYAVHWKHRNRFPEESFNTIRNLCTKYPAYKEEFLDRYFEKPTNKFEDGEVIISKVPIQYEPDESVPIPVFPKVRFWDMAIEKMDLKKAYRTVIERILERGPTTEWEELIRYYGLPRVSNTIRNEILYLTDYTINEVCDFFKFKKEELLCYIRKQSMPKHWI